MESEARCCSRVIFATRTSHVTKEVGSSAKGRRVRLPRAVTHIAWLLTYEPSQTSLHLALLIPFFTHHPSPLPQPQLVPANSCSLAPCASSRHPLILLHLSLCVCVTHVLQLSSAIVFRKPQLGRSLESPVTPACCCSAFWQVCSSVLLSSSLSFLSPPNLLHFP